MPKSKLRLNKKYKVLFRRNSYLWNLRQIFLLFILSIILPLNAPKFIYNSSLRLAPFHAFRVSVVTFFISILCYHAFFWLRKNISSRHTARFIDYVYLSIAALGLIGAADVDQRVYQFDVRNLAYIAESRFSLAIQIIQQEEDHCRSSNGAQCGSLPALRDLAIAMRANVQPAHTPVADVKAALHKFDRALASAPKIKEELDQNWKYNGFDIEAEIRALEDRPFDIGDYYPIFGYQTSMDTVRQISFSLIASALALRLTRVTLEIFGWQRRD